MRCRRTKPRHPHSPEVFPWVGGWGKTGGHARPSCSQKGAGHAMPKICKLKTHMCAGNLQRKHGGHNTGDAMSRHGSPSTIRTYTYITFALSEPQPYHPAAVSPSMSQPPAALVLFRHVFGKQTCTTHPPTKVQRSEYLTTLRHAQRMTHANAHSMAEVAHGT